jgi:hypothetical protein
MQIRIPPMTDSLDDLLEDLRKCFSCKRSPSEISKENCCDMCRPRPKYPDTAPEGTIFVCGACGKTSKSIYGDRNPGLGWDESCMLNAVLCEADSFEKDGIWKAVDFQESDETT